MTVRQANPRGTNPRTEAGRRAIRDAQILIAKERRDGQITRLVKMLDSGELHNLVSEFVVQASLDWEKNGELSDEQVKLLNRLAVLASR